MCDYFKITSNFAGHSARTRKVRDIFIDWRQPMRSRILYNSARPLYYIVFILNRTSCISIYETIYMWAKNNSIMCTQFALTHLKIIIDLQIRCITIKLYANEWALARLQMWAANYSSTNHVFNIYE